MGRREGIVGAYESDTGTRVRRMEIWVCAHEPERRRLRDRVDW